MRKKKKLTQEEYLAELESKKRSKEKTFPYKTEIEENVEIIEENNINSDSLNKNNGSESNNNNTDSKVENKPKKKRSKYPIYITLILAITAITMYFSLAPEFDQIISVFGSMNVPFFIYGCLCFIGVFLINSLILFLFARRYKKKYYFHQAMAIDCIGNFYNCITPSASGGQFMQAYTYKKQGISLSNATSCLVMNFIVYQTVMILIAAISIGVKSSMIFDSAYDMVLTINNVNLVLPFWIVMILGFALQFIVIAALLGMSLSRWFHNFILNRGIGLFAKMKIIKDPDATRRKLSVSLDSFKIELKNLFINPRFLILIIILHFACFTLRYMIPYFINISVLGENTSLYTYSIWDTMLFTSIHKMATELIPIPGSAGVAEVFYYALFKPAYTTGEIPVSVYTQTSQILWRVITFHIPLLVTGVLSAFYKGKPGKEELAKAGEGGLTFLTLQIDTIDDRKRTYETIHNTRMINKKEFEKYKKNKQKSKDSEEGETK